MKAIFLTSSVGGYVKTEQGKVSVKCNNTNHFIDRLKAYSPQIKTLVFEENHEIHSMSNEELYNKGKTEYMNTKAYKDTIQNTYDQGFADGSESKESNPLSYMIPIIVLCALVLVYFGISTNVKKKQKRK